jgi:hypothetical protein
MFHARTATRSYRPPGAPVTPAARTTPAALAIAAALTVGFLAFSVGTADGTPLGENEVPRLTIAGTTVTPHDNKPVPRVRITVVPESTVTFTDVDGDFLVAWSGREGWITLIPEERARDGSEWCKSIVLREHPPVVQDVITLDLGLITVMPRAQIGYTQVPTAPPSHPRPGLLRVQGPEPGEPDTCRMQVSYATDLWGRITRVEVSGGDQPPLGLKDAIFSWIRSVPWTVAAETPCNSPEPFKAREWMNYAWADSAWVQIPGLDLQGRPRPRSSVPQGR